MLRVMTYNLGGGRNIHATSYLESILILIEKVNEIINGFSPDLLFIQEAPEIVTADGETISIVDSIANYCDYQNSYFYGVTLSMAKNLQVTKSIMRDGIFNDWQDWRQGNAVFSKSGFVRFSDPGLSGSPFNIPLFVPDVYQGNRDTDPRYAIFGRVNFASYPYFIGVHLTTLLGERGELIIRGKSDAASVMRLQQLQKVIDLINDDVLACDLPVIILGDLNAPFHEMTIAGLLVHANKFVRLQPNPDLPTHLKLDQAVDHILVYPEHRFRIHQCHIVDNKRTRSASDHLPVIADLDII